MKKLIAAFGVLISFSLSAQTIFYYGNDSVTVNEFLKAYNKNKTNVRTEKAFRDYLNLYIASRLKIKEAKERGYDTLPQMVSDLENLRQQILPNYLNDKEAVNKLVEEAYIRSQKDIHLAHIFISFQQNGTIDTVAALKKLAELKDKLKATPDFLAVAKQFSDDPSAKTNSGDLGWITVFNLPYALENLVYSTGVGKISQVYKSKAGYHIFKNIAERKDWGRIKALQILIANPPGADNSVKDANKKLADSLYQLLLKGADFGALAPKFSNDMVSAASNGQMQEFGVGEYDPVFENAVYSLQKNALSKPFLTSHGYHIVKLLEKLPPVTKTDAKAMETLRSKVEQSDRIASTRTALANRILKQAGYKKSSINTNELWVFSDSVLNSRTTGVPVHVSSSSDLFKIGNKNYLVSDWIGYAQTFRYKPDGSGLKPYPQLWDEFVQAMALNYYQANLENYNEEFKAQIDEFKDGNLFFEIMQREVWGPAQTDSIALAKYFEKNRSKYNWKPSADAVIFYANDMVTAKTFNSDLKKAPASWHELVNTAEDKIAADSSRFEISQIPNPAKQVLQPGTVTTPLLNKSDNTASFAYIIRNYNKTEPRNFADARGLVINDYQIELEKNWVDQLKKKYPVKINEKVLNNLIASKKY
jgi:peptidyl-prolyl cis-trans isomerase SurA